MKKIVIFGAGLAGSTIARVLAEKGVQVQIYEKESHCGGHVYDRFDENGFLLQMYGPHIFHTKYDDVWEWVNNITDWKSFDHKPGVNLLGIETPSPFNFQTIDQFYSVNDAEEIKNAFQKSFPGRETITIMEAFDSDNPFVKKFADFLWNEDYAPYTAKQWGRPISEIPKTVLSRVPLRLSYNEGYFTDPYQAMPLGGYTNFVSRILDHPNINVDYNVDPNLLEITEKGLTLEKTLTNDLIVHTGPIDKLFSEKYGRLPYRSLEFTWKYLPEVDSYQGYSVVAVPADPDYTRITEFKKLPIQNLPGTVLTFEKSIEYDGKVEPYYPISNDDSEETYRKYSEEAKKLNNLFMAGRLGGFKYFNMDQTIKNSLEISSVIASRLS